MNREVGDLMIVEVVGWNVTIVLEADDDNDGIVKDSTNLQHDGDRYVQIAIRRNSVLRVEDVMVIIVSIAAIA